jgi:hypothetical protein
MTSDTATEYPPLASHIGKRGVLVFPPDGHRQQFTIVDEITRMHRGVPSKIICLQLLRFDEDGRKQVRVGYYVIGKKPKMRGRWVWGQYSSMMPLEDFRWVVQEAQKKGWF